MHEALLLAVAWAGGALLSALFFGGLWWTVRKGVTSKHPGLWFAGSVIVRMSAAVAGFCVVSGGRSERLLLCLLGFFMASLFVRRLAPRSGKGPAGRGQEGSRASHA